MAPKRISQETFDEVVKENMEDFDMEPEEAISDAVNQFVSQGVDLSKVVKSNPLTRGDNQAIVACNTLRDQLETLDAAVRADPVDIIRTLSTLREEGKKSLENRTLAGRNGGVTASILAMRHSDEQVAAAGLETAQVLCRNHEDNRDFVRSEGMKSLVALLQPDRSASLHEKAFTTAQIVCTKNEANKGFFVTHGGLTCLSASFLIRPLSAPVVRAAAGCLRSVTTGDDRREDFSKCYDTARELGKLGAVSGILSCIRDLLDTAATQEGGGGVDTPSAGTAVVVAGLCAGLRQLANNDETCGSIVAQGGLTVLLQVLDQLMVSAAACRYSASVLRSIAANDAHRTMLCLGHTHTDGIVTGGRRRGWQAHHQSSLPEAETQIAAVAAAAAPAAAADSTASPDSAADDATTDPTADPSGTPPAATSPEEKPGATPGATPAARAEVTPLPGVGMGLTLLLAALRTHPKDVGVCEQVCATLAAMSLRAPANTAAIAKVGGPEAVLDVMRQYARLDYVAGGDGEGGAGAGVGAGAGGAGSGSGSGGVDKELEEELERAMGEEGIDGAGLTRASSAQSSGGGVKTDLASVTTDEIFPSSSNPSGGGGGGGVVTGPGHIAVAAEDKAFSSSAIQSCLRVACLALRNFSSRNPELRAPMLSAGAEPLLRAVSIYKGVNDEACAALRDLGCELSYVRAEQALMTKAVFNPSFDESEVC